MTAAMYVMAVSGSCKELSTGEFDSYDVVGTVTSVAVVASAAASPEAGAAVIGRLRAPACTDPAVQMGTVYTDNGGRYRLQFGLLADYTGCLELEVQARRGRTVTAHRMLQAARAGSTTTIDIVLP